jgi:hypothetical protein
MKTSKPNQTLKRLSCLPLTLAISLGTLTACTQPQQLSIPGSPSSGQVTSPQATDRPQDVQSALREKLALSPRRLQMLARARAQSADPAFQKLLANRKNTLTTQNGFSTLSGPRDTQNHMYSLRQNNEIHEVNPATGSTTLLTHTLNNITSWAIAKDPLSNSIYYTGNDAPHPLFKYDRSNQSHTLIGNIGMQGPSYMLGFSPDGNLYAADQQGLYLVDKTTAQKLPIPVQNWPTGNGDLAFDQSGQLYVGVSAQLYRIDLEKGQAINLGNPNLNGTLTGLGFDANNRLLATTDQYALYEITNPTSAPQGNRLSYSQGNSLLDLTSAYVNSCPAMSDQRSFTPGYLFQNDFSKAAANFGNLNGENNPDNESGWKQWNGDYYPTGKGVSLWNPGVFDPSTGGIDDPQHDIRGIRNYPGEYAPGGLAYNPADPRPNLLETAIARTTALHYQPGDRLIAKVSVAPNFTDNDSDSTVYLLFDDPAGTVAVSQTLRGSLVSGAELMIDAEIPACATEVTLIALGYLGQNEKAALSFEKASLEFIPGDYYASNPLLNENFDRARQDEKWGSQSPNLDEEFGNYDIYLVNQSPETDKAVTAARQEASSGAGGTGELGGLVKRIPLDAYTAGDALSTELFTATTFTDKTSEASLMLEFFNAQDEKISTVNSSKMTARQFGWTTIDRALIPAQTAYAKVVPVFRLGTQESSSFLWQQLNVDLIGRHTLTAPTQVQLNTPQNNALLAKGAITQLSATPNAVAPGLQLVFVNRQNQILATGSKQADGSYRADWTPSTAGQYSMKAQVLNTKGEINASSPFINVVVVDMTLQFNSPGNNWRQQANQDMYLSAQVNAPAQTRLRLRIVDANGNIHQTLQGSDIIAYGGTTYGAKWRPTAAEIGKAFTLYLDILDASGKVLKTSEGRSGNVVQ